MRRNTNHAVVLGAGMAGLLVAGVLAEFHDRVTLVERDSLPAGAQNRRGVPQGRHAHVLMPRGTQLLDELCHGLVHDLIAGGAVLTEPLADWRFRVGGHQLPQVPIGGSVVQATRPFLEHRLRRRVGDLPGVTILDDCDVTGVLTDETGTRITAARIMRRAAGSTEETLAADLVVDAMGRGGRTPVWLEALGYGRPVEESPKIDIRYSSQLLRLPTGIGGIEKTIGIGPVPGLPRGMVLVEVENGYSVLTVQGLGTAHRPPGDYDGLLAAAATVAPDDVMEVLRAAEPKNEVATYRFPSYRRRRYERMRRFPEGLLVIGDGLCSFSPIYAQGMTVAAQQALALRACLERGDHRLAHRFFHAASRIVDAPWRSALNADLALPEVERPRSVPVRAVNRYVAWVLAAAERDEAIARQFMRVSTLLDAPSALFRPNVLSRVVLRRRLAPPPAAERDVAVSGTR